MNNLTKTYVKKVAKWGRTIADILTFYYRRLKKKDRSNFDESDEKVVNDIKEINSEMIQVNMYVIASIRDLESVPDFVRRIHITFRPTGTFIMQIIMKCKGIDLIHMPESYCDSISVSSKLVLRKEQVNVIQGEIWGHRKDISDYAQLKLNKNELIFPLKS